MKSTPAYYIAQTPDHPQVWMNWQGKRVKVDEVLLPLLKILNSIDGIATISSCAGTDSKEYGFVLMAGDSQEALDRAMLTLAKCIDTPFAEFGFNKDSEGNRRLSMTWRRSSLVYVTETLRMDL